MHLKNSSPLDSLPRSCRSKKITTKPGSRTNRCPPVCGWCIHRPQREFGLENSAAICSHLGIPREDQRANGRWWFWVTRIQSPKKTQRLSPGELTHAKVLSGIEQSRSRRYDCECSSLVSFEIDMEASIGIVHSGRCSSLPFKS